MASIRDRAAAIFDYKISKQMVLSLDPGVVLPFLHGWCLSEKTCKEITKINETDRQLAVTELKSGIAHYFLSLDESDTDIYEQLECVVDAFETANAGPCIINLLRGKLQSLAQADPPKTESHQGQSSRPPVPVVSTEEAASSKPMVLSAESPIPGKAVTADPRARLDPGEPATRSSSVPSLLSTESATSHAETPTVSASQCNLTDQSHDLVPSSSTTKSAVKTLPLKLQQSRVAEPASDQPQTSTVADPARHTASTVRHRAIDASGASYLANKRILLIGGLTGYGGYGESRKSVESYSPITNTSQLLDIKLRKDRYKHVCGVLSDTEVMVAGGGETGFFGLGNPGKSTEVINLQTLRVKAGPSLIIGRHRASSAMYNGEMYVTGGQKDGILWSCELFRRGRWVKIADMMRERCGHGLAAVGDYLYAIGGCGGVGVGLHDSVEFYSPQTNQWTLMTSKSNYKRMVAAAEHEGVIYAAGGGAGAGDRFKLCERFDPREDKWHTIGDMNVKRVSFCLVSCGEKLYALGGGGDGAMRSIESYDPRVDKWVMEETWLREWRLSSASVVVPFSL